MPPLDRLLLCILMLAVLTTHSGRADDPGSGAAVPPGLGETAKDFTLTRLDGETLQLAKLREQGPVVLLVLRGFPGYQCPVCNRQVGQFISRAKEFSTARTNVVMVYPGPSAGLQEHAAEFVTGKTLPEGFHLLLDPDYAFTTAYGLRWDAAGETAYPSTFVIAEDGTIKFAKVSRSHGDRSIVADVLQALPR